MLSPDYLLHISEGAEAVSESLHIDIIRRIVERMAARMRRGDDYILTALDRWQIETLQEVGLLLEDIQREIAAKTPYQMQEIKAAMEEAGVRALAHDNAIYRAAGLLPPLEGLTEQTAADLLMRETPYYIRLMQRNYEATLGEWRNFTGTLPEAGYRLYVEQCDKAYTLVQSGAVSYTQAFQEAINETCKAGVKVKYPSGHQDTIETATLRAVRTGTAQASEQISLMRAKEVGTALRLTSAHLGARPEHELWQGEVFWVDWDKLNAVYPALANVANPTPATPEQRAKYREFVETTGIGTVNGLAGANCRHTSSVFFEGISHNPYKEYDAKENKRVYEQTQKQRAMERAIRKTKREVMGLKAAAEGADAAAKPGLEAEYQKKAALLRRQNEEYNKFCKENDLRPLQDRLTIAQWDRKQAAAAREAAKKNVANYADSGIMNVQKAEPASLRFLSNRDGLYKNAANIKPLDGFEDIVCHSDSVTLEFHDPDSGETIANVSAKRMAQYIRDSDRYTGKPIRLIACQSGAWEFGPAQQLADELGVDVLAPSETVYVMPDGKMYITDDPRGRMEEINTGEWVLFKPRR